MKDHYKKLEIEPTDYIHANGLGFIEGNVIKYVTRYKDKGGKQDLEKAIDYLRTLIEKEYGSGNNPTPAYFQNQNIEYRKND
jgi:hypothetical protein